MLGLTNVVEFNWKTDKTNQNLDKTISGNTCIGFKKLWVMQISQNLTLSLA